MMSRPQVPGRTARGVSRLPLPGDQCTPQGPVPTRELRFSPENPASVLCLYRNTLGVRKNSKPSGGGFFPTNTRKATGGSTAPFDAGAGSKAGPIAPTRPPGNRLVRFPSDCRVPPAAVVPTERLACGVDEERPRRGDGVGRLSARLRAAPVGHWRAPIRATRFGTLRFPGDQGVPSRCFRPPSAVRKHRRGGSHSERGGCCPLEWCSWRCSSP